MKTELTDKFEDVEIRRFLYGKYRVMKVQDTVDGQLIFPWHELPLSPDALREDFEEYVKDIQSIEKEIAFDRRIFLNREGDPGKVLQKYGPSTVVVDYMCDNFVDWQGGQIYRVDVKDGSQAQRLLEYCLNNYSMKPEIVKSSHQPFDKIPFGLLEALQAGRTLYLGVGVCVPTSSWREGYRIFVDQKSDLGRNTEIKSPSWYSDMFGVFPPKHSREVQFEDQMPYDSRTETESTSSTIHLPSRFGGNPIRPDIKKEVLEVLIGERLSVGEMAARLKTDYSTVYNRLTRFDLRESYHKAREQS